MKKVLHFSGLNGLRAIAALAVLFEHTTEKLGTFGLNILDFGKYSDGTSKAFSLAQYGVTIFFTLSGFLITYLLLEENKIKEINVKNFYIRRILRIWPLYYLYLILSILTLILFNISFESQTILFYVFLLANIPFIFRIQLNLLGHYWSLGVEEQFYSFWPWVIKKSKSVLNSTIIICISLLLLKIIFRFSNIKNFTGNVNWLYEIISLTRFDCMLIGAIGAILYFQNNSLLLKITNNYLSQSIAWFVILLVALNKFHIISFLDNEFISIVTVFIILGQIEKKHRIVNLDNGIFDFIGKISYGIYVIHPLVIFYLSKTFSFFDQTNVFNYIIVYIIVFLTTIFISYLSYEFFEKRFLTLKEKYSTINSSGNMQK